MSNMEISKDRFKFLYGLGNCYCIFRPIDFSGLKCSEHYYDCGLYEHKAKNIEDLLKVIDISIYFGELDIQVCDIIGIKINGNISCYLYTGKNSVSGLMNQKSYIRVPDFFKIERNSFIHNLHYFNRICNILDGNIFSIDSVLLKEYDIYALSNEIFHYNMPFGNWNITNYSLFQLEHGNIKNVNPNNKPFQNIETVIYYLSKKNSKRKNIKKKMVVYNRYELELLQDVYKLNKMLG